jgi:membrane-associated protease RseP (regulator of RpoE activity)
VTTFLLFIGGVLIFLVGLAISVGLHELGHLLPAKLFGVRVRQYMIGFGPTIVSKKFGDTEYGIKAIPLGGFVSLSGMFPPGKELRPAKNPVTRFFRRLIQDARDASSESMQGTDESRALYRLPVYKRIIVMAGGPVMNLILAFVLLAVVVSGFGLAGATTTVGAVAECVLPVTAKSSECTASDAASPASVAGLKPGDTIVAIDGTTITEWTQATAITHASAGKTLNYVVLRDGKELTLAITPQLTTRYDFNADGTPVLDAAGSPVLVEMGIAGISPEVGRVVAPISDVFPLMGDAVAQTGQMILQLPQKIVGVGEAAFSSAPRDITGPVSVVGVGRVAGEIASTDVASTTDKLVALIGVLASLNIALFAFNLIPLLPLDGGHIAGAIWEAIRRGWAKLRHKADPGPVDISRLMPLTFVVVTLLFAMSALLIYADIVKPISVLG